MVNVEVLEKLFRLIRELIENKFYGELVIKFEAGKITICKKTESIKI
jgi:hypothetical protein